MAVRLTLTIERELFAICRLAPATPPPAWALAAPYFSMTRTRDELSIVVAQSLAPADIVASRGWRMIRFAGPMPLDQTGILASVTSPLAQARVSVFAVATYDTDYVLIPSDQLQTAVTVLEAAGHAVSVGL
ncbi:MAG: ACT domain-containing protein [Proteobacteria bacterium]|nr:ACT domain-containing protein [Pseudomonadota bacterium]